MGPPTGGGGHGRKRDKGRQKISLRNFPQEAAKGC